jgi:hypothetical protein
MLSVVFELFTSSVSVVRHFNRKASNSSLIVSVRVFVPEPPEFLAEIVTEKVPPTAGVPVITPVEVLTPNPSGKGVAL